MCLFLALFIAYRDFRWSVKYLNGKSLMDIVLRDSLLYFAVICITDLAWAMFWHRGTVSTYLYARGKRVTHCCLQLFYLTEIGPSSCISSGYFSRSNSRYIKVAFPSVLAAMLLINTRAPCRLTRTGLSGGVSEGHPPGMQFARRNSRRPTMSEIHIREADEVRSLLLGGLTR